MRGQQLKQWRGGHFAAGVQIDCNAPRARFTKEAQSAARCLVCCDAALARRKTKAPRAKVVTQRLFDEVGVSRVCRHRVSTLSLRLKWAPRHAFGLPPHRWARTPGVVIIRPR